jgi:hypothetical protein
MPGSATQVYAREFDAVHARVPSRIAALIVERIRELGSRLESWERECAFLLCFLLLGVTVCAQEPRPHRIGELSFLLPITWQTKEATAAGATGVVFIAHGGGDAQLTVARLPVTAAPPPLQASSVDPLTSPETAMHRVFLEESGLTPTAGVAAAAQEPSAAVTSVSFECKSETALVVVLTCTWTTPREVVRARLQFPANAAIDHGAELDAIRASLRFAGRNTLGFGDYRLAHAPALPNAATWAKLSAASPPPASSSASSSSAPGGRRVPTDIGQIVQQYRGSLIIIEGGGGAGSGFLCQMPDGVYFLTNQHVASEMQTLRLTSLDRTPVPIGSGGAAVGHDIIRFTTTSTAPPLIAASNVDAEAKIGDPIVVLGNSEGARVVQSLPGKLVGIGPDRIEVSSEFVPGNSGSPIVHLPTGKVIGIATYLTKKKFAEFTDSGAEGVRRFGYRVDTVKTWQPVAWGPYRSEKASLDQVTSLTKDLARLIGEMSKGPIEAGGFASSPIYRPIRDYQQTATKRTLSQADRHAALQNFLSSIRAATQGDIVRTRKTLHYDFFQHRLSEEGMIREQMYKLFDDMAKGGGAL